MKIKLSWQHQEEGSHRTIALSGPAPKIWVFLEGPDGAPAPHVCKLRAVATPTRHPLFLLRHPFAPSSRTGKELIVTSFETDKPYFVIASQLPRWRLPYWIDFIVERESEEIDRTQLFVVPAFSRVASYAAIVAGALSATYLSWLLLSVTSDSLPKGITWILATLTGIGSPALALLAPFASLRVRRTVVHIAWTATLASLAMVAALLVHLYQDPVYIENNAPTSLDLLQDGKQLLVESGSAVVVSRHNLPALFIDYTEGKRKDLPHGHWFSTGNYCIRSAESDGASCLELRPANWAAKLQRWIALGDTIRIGCSAFGADADLVEAWKRSGSCKRDPELRVVRVLTEHLTQLANPLQTKPTRADSGSSVADHTKLRLLKLFGQGSSPPPAVTSPSTALPCTDPSGEVTIRPFRGAPGVTANYNLRQLEFQWSEKRTASLPSWSFTGKELIAEVRQRTLLRSDASCSASLKQDCSQLDADEECAFLQAPPGEISATIEQGDQKIGTLRCAADTVRILSARTKSRVLRLRVLAANDEPLSYYESALIGPGEWVFWCETDRPESAGSTRVQPPLRAQVTLASDWQPLEAWRWNLLTSSRIGRLDIDIHEHGRWGTLECGDIGAKRTLSLLEGHDNGGRAFATVTLGNRMKWTRYAESSSFPNWVWRCSDAKSAPEYRLDTTLSGGTAGFLDRDGHFIASTGVPCLIDPVTKHAVARARPERYPPNARSDFSAASYLASWPQPPCDPSRSYLIGIESRVRREESL